MQFFPRLLAKWLRRPQKHPLAHHPVLSSTPDEHLTTTLLEQWLRSNELRLLLFTTREWSDASLLTLTSIAALDSRYNRFLPDLAEGARLGPEDVSRRLSDALLHHLSNLPPQDSRGRAIVDGVLRLDLKHTDSEMLLMYGAVKRGSVLEMCLLTCPPASTDFWTRVISVSLKEKMVKEDYMEWLLRRILQHPRAAASETVLAPVIYDSNSPALDKVVVSFAALPSALRICFSRLVRKDAVRAVEALESVPSERRGALAPEDLMFLASYPNDEVRARATVAMR